MPVPFEGDGVVCKNEDALARRLGVSAIDAPPDEVGPALVNRYLDIRRQELI